MIRPASSAVELELRVQSGVETLGGVKRDSPWVDFSFSSRKKSSSFNLGMKVTVLGSKYTGSCPSTTFLSLLEKYLRSSLDIFLFWLLEGGGDCCWFGDERGC